MDIDAMGKQFPGLMRQVAELMEFKARVEPLLPFFEEAKMVADRGFIVRNEYGQIQDLGDPQRRREAAALSVNKISQDHKHHETDADLRMRLLTMARGVDRFRVQTASGAELDAIAAEHDMGRLSYPG